MPGTPGDNEAQLRKLYRYCFARGTVGPQVLADLMAYAGVLDAGMEPDPRMQDFWSGRRDVVLYILSCMGMSQDYLDIARAMIKAPVRAVEPRPTEGDNDAFDGN